MKVDGWMPGSNSALESVLSQGASFQSESYAARAANGRRIATTMQQQEVGKNAARQMELNAEETEESLEEQIARKLEEKKAAEKAETEAQAQRIAQKNQTAPATTTGSASRSDMVEISEAGQAAAQGVAVVRTPAAQIPASNPVGEASGSAQVRSAAPASEQVNVSV